MELLFSGMGTEVKRDNGQYQGSPHFVHPDNRFQLQKPIRNIRKEVSRAVIDTAHYYRRPIENSWIFDALGSKVPWNFPPTFRQASKIRLSTISLFFSILFFFSSPIFLWRFNRPRDEIIPAWIEYVLISMSINISNNPHDLHTKLFV